MCVVLGTPVSAQVEKEIQLSHLIDGMSPIKSPD